MSNTASKRQNAALPPIIRKEVDGKALGFYRVKQNKQEAYVLEAAGKPLHSLDAWQYHVLNALFSFGGDKYPSLLVNVNDRFGLKLVQEDIEDLFAALKDHDLFDAEEAKKHPLIAEFLTSGVKRKRNKAAPVDKESAIEKETKRPSSRFGFAFRTPTKIIADITQSLKEDIENISPASEEAVMSEALDADVDAVKTAKEIFTPTAFFRRYQAYLAKARFMLYPLPFLAFAAVFIAMSNASLLVSDTTHIISGFSILTHLFLGLVTVNALATLTKASAIYEYGGTVNSIGLKWFFGFMPRFVVKFEDTAKFSRRQKLWVYAAPVVTRLAICSLGVLVWHNTRYLGNAIPAFSLAIAFISFVSLMITVCPLHKSNGYFFLSEFMNEPHLRGKGTKALLNRFHKDAYRREDSIALLIYGLASLLFVFAFAAAAFTMLYGWLKFDIGANAVLVVGALVAIFASRIWKHMKKVNEAYHRNYRFERWRARTLDQDNNTAASTEKTPPLSGKQKTAIACVLMQMIFPYKYQPSGQVVLLPVAQQQISTDIAGIVAEVYYEGGESLKAGTVIAKLSTADIQAMLDIEKAKLEEKKVQLTFSKDRFDRQKQLYESKAISLEAFDKVKLEFEQAQAAVPVSEAQIKLYEDQIARSEFRMPFDGTIKTLQLKEQKGRFLNVGEPVASVEDSSGYKAELVIPEADLPYVKIGDKAQVRTRAYPGKPFEGTVKAIDANIEGESWDRTVKMVIAVQSDGRALKSGMSGFAKTDGESIAFYKVLTRAITRFITVDLWAWVP